MSGKRTGGRIRRRADSTSSSQSSDEENSQTKQSRAAGSQRQNASQSQNISAVPSRQMRAELNEDDKKRLVADAVFFVLVQEQKRAVHKKGDILKAIGMTGRPRELQDHIMDKTAQKLEHVFGMTFDELPEKKGQYILVNKLFQTKDDIHIEISPKEKAHLAVLYSILGLIYMSNGVIRDEALDQFLEKMGLMARGEDLPPTQVHQSRGQPRNTAASLGISEDIYDTFGDIKELIRKEWGQKQHYLDVARVDSTDADAAESVSYEYSWGRRAELEVKKSDLLRKICKLYNCKPSAFKEQYDQIRKEEGENVFEEDEEDETEAEDTSRDAANIEDEDMDE